MRAPGAWVSRGQPAPHLPQQQGRYRGHQGDPEVPTPTGLGTGEADIHDLAAPQPWDLARGWKTDHRKQTQEAREKLLSTKALSLRELDVGIPLDKLTHTCSHPSPPDASGQALVQPLLTPPSAAQAGGVPDQQAPRNPPNPPQAWSGEQQREQR